MAAMNVVCNWSRIWQLGDLSAPHALPARHRRLHLLHVQVVRHERALTLKLELHSLQLGARANHVRLQHVISYNSRSACRPAAGDHMTGSKYVMHEEFQAKSS